jgi:hypothetical protein
MVVAEQPTRVVLDVPHTEHVRACAGGAAAEVARVMDAVLG